MRVMKKGYLSSKISFISWIAVLLILPSVPSADSSSPDDPTAGCPLDFRAFPYQPSGECVGTDEKITTLNQFDTNVCCRNVLVTLSKAIAGRFPIFDTIFLRQDQWNNCSRPFLRQPSASASSCQFDNLYSGLGGCGDLTWDQMMSRKTALDARDACSGLSSDYDGICMNCSTAVQRAVDELVNGFGLQHSSGGKEICTVAVLSFVAATGIENHPWVEDFYSCMPALDILEPGYTQIKSSVIKLLYSIVLAAIGLALVILLTKYVTRSRKDAEKVKLEEIKDVGPNWSGLYRFTKKEIENAINSGTEKKYLGRGSAGQVYRGVLPSGQVVAIKHIFKGNISDSFNREVNGLSRVRHPNLVCLFGCCIEDGEQYLVYEYCSQGNLAQHILRKDTLLTWDKRVRILRDCALGLRYLHQFVDGCIVHRDIKLTNILLTEELLPKLSDFGLAKMLGMEQTKVFTDVRGTIGYMDPEYMSNAKLTCASDIYSFGIVILQLLSGRKVIELDFNARDLLTRMAKDVSLGKRPAPDFEDPRLSGIVNTADFVSILDLAVLCVAKSSKGRPNIGVVFDELDKAWNNTQAEMVRKGIIAASPSHSVSMDAIPV